MLWVLALHAITVTAALVVSLMPPVDRLVEAALQLSFQRRPGTVSEAASILLTNARVIGAVLLLAYAVRRGISPSWAAALIAGALTAGNAAIVGCAAGAYGIADTAPWLIHLPLEWAALGVSAAAVTTSDRRLNPARAGALALPWLVAAALVETYASPR